MLFFKAVKVVILGLIVDGVCDVVVSLDGSTPFVAGHCVLAIWVKWMAAMGSPLTGLWPHMGLAGGVGRLVGGGFPGRPGDTEAKFDCCVKVGCGHLVVLVGWGK